jgi:hypothetical protein
VQKSREAVLRLSCQNNLKQIGLAMENYQLANSAYPPTGYFPVGGAASNSWSAPARLLPYIEQENLFRQIDFNTPYSAQPNVSMSRIATFVCPAEVNDVGKANATGVVVHWPINYTVNVGTWQVWDPTTGTGGDGAFVPTTPLRPQNFSDGMSNTLAFSEVKAYTSQLTKGGNPNVATAALPASPTALVALGGTVKVGTPGVGGGHTEWVDGKILETGFTTLFPPNTRIAYVSGADSYDVDFITANEGNTTNQFAYAAVTARSYHADGVNALRMDGSVKFQSNTIRPEVWRALGTRAGGEVVSD